jgi:hypothetical protein
MKRLINAYLVSFCVILAGCKIDNYPAPNGAVYGSVVDKVTNEPLQTEQPNGFVIRLFEKGKSKNSPISFTGKPDGSFENAMLFREQYQAIPVEGAFFPVTDTTVVDVKDRTELKFSVIPFLVVTNATVKTEKGKVIASYGIFREKVGDKIVERKLLVSKIVTVNNVVFDFKKETNLASVEDSDVLNREFTDEVSGLAPGDYYVRVAARTNNALRKYNYSKPFKVTVP